jgi:predicted lipoprotein
MNAETFRELSAKAAEMAAMAEARDRELAESIETRERELAAMAEQLSQDPAVQAAFQQGVQYERARVLTLIDVQLSTLFGANINALSLRAHRRQVMEVAA